MQVLIIHVEAFNTPSKCFVLLPSASPLGLCGPLMPLACPSEVHMEPDSTNALQTKINTKSVISSRANAATVDFGKTSSLGSWDGACKNTNRLLHKKNSEWLYLQKGREKGGRQDEGKKWKN